MNSAMRLLLIALALTAVLAPAAQAASRNEIIRDCADDGRLNGDYSAGELRDARQNLPADVDEYTDCRDVLRRAELGDGSGGAGGAGTVGGGGTGLPGTPGAPLTPSSPAEERALAAARAEAGEPLTVAGRKVLPGASGFAAYAARHELPWPLIAALVLLGVAAVAAATPAIRRRVLSRRAQPA